MVVGNNDGVFCYILCYIHSLYIPTKRLNSSEISSLNIFSIGLVDVSNMDEDEITYSYMQICTFMRVYTHLVVFIA